MTALMFLRCPVATAKCRQPQFRFLHGTTDNYTIVIIVVVVLIKVEITVLIVTGNVTDIEGFHAQFIFSDRTVRRQHRPNRHHPKRM